MEFAGKNEVEVLAAAQQAINNGASSSYVVKYLMERGAAADVAQRAVDEALRLRVNMQRETIDRPKEVLAEARKLLIWRAVLYLVVALVVGGVGIALKLNSFNVGGFFFFILAARVFIMALMLE